ncbi:uncharacterized protein LOC133806731 [Humulus lupulus]|uniref:uncharacterized protein LOC133806731 n=1 Tax=Humulus lupulus TaxID=3486 RepID=UPI002B414A05|nr:uncharacterized protein LOC133806731 [Humulus lupulus]
MGRLNFEGLRNLHNSANDLLLVQQCSLVVDYKRQEKRVDEVSEASLRMLEVCGVSKDVLLLVKEHLQHLQFTLRRLSIGELTNIENKISDYNRYRKKLKKETLNCLNSLKQVVVVVVPSSVKNDNLSVVVDVLREVRVTTISIVESLFSLIDKPWLGLDQIKSAKTSSFLGYSKFKRVSNNNTGQSLYDIYDSMELRSADKRLVAVKITIDCIEVELESIIRRLIQTRVSLLNILTN